MPKRAQQELFCRVLSHGGVTRNQRSHAAYVNLCPNSLRTETVQNSPIGEGSDSPNHSASCPKVASGPLRRWALFVDRFYDYRCVPMPLRVSSGNRRVVFSDLGHSPGWTFGSISADFHDSQRTG